jgi:hypothetical protein
MWWSFYLTKSQLDGVLGVVAVGTWPPPPPRSSG